MGKEKTYRIEITPFFALVASPQSNRLTTHEIDIGVVEAATGECLDFA